jgi:hypothetical protein
MTEEPAASVTKRVRGVFLIFGRIDEVTAPFAEATKRLQYSRQQIALAFLDSLRGVVRTLGIPFQYTYSQVHSLHWQRHLMAERIRARSIDDESMREGAARAAAKLKFDEFVSAETGKVIADDVLGRLAALADEPEALSAARELARQGIVLTWSAFEVFARDLFVELLNERPALVERLLSHVASRKRFTVDKIDWQTLSTYNFDLSRSLGDLLSQRSDLDDIQTIRDAYNALYPSASALNQTLANEDLWHLFQRRNLIVHRRGIVDRHYIEKTGSPLALGTHFWATPDDIETHIESVIAAATALVSEVANDG